VLTDLIMAGGESMLVFTQYTQMATLLQRHLDAHGIGSVFLSGLELLHAEWNPAAEDPDAAELLQAARAALHTKTGAAESVLGNRITTGRLQLRLGRDLRWYPYARSDTEWEPSGPPQADPAQAVADL
jgi:hypothetical protein